VTSVIVHYSELALKGRNRPWFIQAMVRTIRSLLADLDVTHIALVHGRIEIRLQSGDHWDEVRARLGRLPGIANFARAVNVPADLDRMAATVVDGLRGRPPRPFRIRAKRADKRFPIASPEIERHVGARVQAELGWPVDLTHPQSTIRIEVMSGDAFVILDREPGVGGLPIGSGGKALCLISGGIDSPVAAWRILRRGVRVQLVHFHSYPILDSSSQEKVRELATILTRSQLRTRLYLVPFGAVQQQVVVTVPPEMRVIIYRRLMIRMAQHIAARVHADALVTGEVLGQVASQTIENMRAIDDAAVMPILRPLVGFDKEEITREAIRLGTYETSILPDQDCCTLFTPRNPATRAGLGEVRDAEALLDVEALVDMALQGTVVEERRFPLAGHALDEAAGPAQKDQNDRMRRSFAQEMKP
jgi:thiamine biosynthesis protein ThiI